MQQKGTPKQIKNYIYYNQNKIGKGSFSVVYLGNHITTNQTVAIKVIDAKSLKTDIERMLVGHEMKALKLMNHQNVIRAIEIYQTSNNIYIVYDYCEMGDLQHYVKSKTRIFEDEALQIMSQLISGTMHIHSKGVIHRDLKPQNILIKNKVFKIIDFGFCEVNDSKIQQSYNVGSPLYMSPEAYKLSKYTTKSDSWALGIIFLQMLLGELPFRGLEYDLLLQQLTSGEAFKNLTCSSLSKTLLFKLLTIDQARRIDCTEAYNILASNKIEQTKALGANNPNIMQNKNPIHGFDSKSIIKPNGSQFGTNQRNIRGSVVMNLSPAPKAKPRDISPARVLDKALAYVKPKQNNSIIQEHISLNRSQSLFKLKICDKMYHFLLNVQQNKKSIVYNQQILLLGLKVIKQYLQSVTIVFQQDAKSLTQQQQNQLCYQINRFNQIQARYSQNTLFSDLYFSFAIEYLRLQYQFFNYLQFWIKQSMTQIKKRLNNEQKQTNNSKIYLYLLASDQLLEYLKKNPNYMRGNGVPENKMLDMMIADKSIPSWNHILQYEEGRQKQLSSK